MSTRGYRESVDRVYLVEVKDARFSDGWYPRTAFLHKEAAEDYAETYRQTFCDFARVTELKVVKNDRD